MASDLAGNPGGPSSEEGRRPVGLRPFLIYFLRLGALGFGGPIALAGHMQRDLVDERHWITEQEYAEGLALAQLAPGPLAAQLAIYLGWVRAGVAGATLVALTFILPSFLMVVAISALYVRYGGLSWMQGAFYGIGAAVIAIIARSAVKLTRSTLHSNRLLWALFVASAVATAWTQTEVVWVFVLCGGIALTVERLPHHPAAALALAPWPLWLLTGLHGPAAPATLWQIGIYFAQAGAFVFGSGLAIVPFLHGGVVGHFHWLNERQFVDAVAVAMITPGPVVITVAFIGYLVAGPLGAVAAALGVFLPCYLLAIVPAPYYHRVVGNRYVRAFVGGVTAAAVGAIAGATLVLGRRAITDIPTAAIAVLVLAVLSTTRRVPEPFLILIAGGIGILLSRMSWAAGGTGWGASYHP